MNPAKKNSGWILCPSKSFPGKFYYFNVANGETAWSLNEAEKQFLKNPLQKVDKPHYYPEPSEPPSDSPTVSQQRAYVNEPLLQKNSYFNSNKSVTSRNTYWSNNEALSRRDTYIPNATLPCHDPFLPNNKQLIRRDFSVPKPEVFPYSHESAPQYNSYTPYKSLSNVKQNRPVFGQKAFPVQPMQIQVPLIISPDKYTPNVVMIMMNQTPNRFNDSTQNESKLDVHRELFVQSSGVLGQRFVNFKTDETLRTPKSPEQNYNRYGISTPNSKTSLFHNDDELSIESCGLSKMKVGSIQRKPFIREPILNFQNPTHKTSNIFAKTSESPFKSGNVFSQIIRDKPNIFENFPDKKSNDSQTRFIIKFDEQKSPQPQTDTNQNRINTEKLPSNKISNSYDKTVKTDIGIVKEKPTVFQENKEEHANDSGHLHDNDLRCLLMAKKKRKLSELDENEVRGKKMKMCQVENQTAVTPKKKVTFNIPDDEISDIISTENFTDDNLHTNTGGKKSLRQLLPSSDNNHPWYLVVDNDVLLEELDLLESYTKFDPQCHILIPSRVMSDLRDVSRREYHDTRVTSARQVLRRFWGHHDHIIVQPSQMEDDNNISMEDSIITCCIETAAEISNVMLVTNNENLRAKAKSLDISCFNIQEIKDVCLKKPDVNFDINKIKITLENPPGKTTNTIPSHIYRKKLFDTQANTKKTVECTENPDWAYDSLNKNNQLHIQKDMTKNTIQSTLKKLDDTIPSYFENTNTTPNSKKLQETVSVFFQNKNNNKQNMNSRFTINKKETQNKSNAFVIDGIEKIPPLQKPQTSIFDYSRPVCGNEKYKNIEIELNNSIFDTNVPTKCSSASDFENNAQKSYYENEKYRKIEVQLDNSFCKNQTLNLKATNVSSEYEENDNAQKSIFESVTHKNEMQKCNNMEQSTASIFDREKYKNRNEKCEKQHSSIFESNKHKHNATPSILENEKYKNSEHCSSIFESAKYEYKKQYSSIFDIEPYENGGQSRTNFERRDEPIFSEEITESNLKQCIKMILQKNHINERRIEQRNEEVMCSFNQIMEECLTDFLENASIHKSMPHPWTFYEALQCTVMTYGAHKSVRTLVNYLSSVLDVKGTCKPRDSLRVVGGGLLLVDYLKKLQTPAAECLLEAEESIRSVLENDPHSLEHSLKTPVFCRTDISCEMQGTRSNFVKDSNHVLNYLKRHYPAWTNYDETQASPTKPAWGQRSKEVKVVRTFGKNLNMLKLDKSKYMSIDTPLHSTKNNYQIIENHKNIHEKITYSTIENKMAKSKEDVKINAKTINIKEHNTNNITYNNSKEANSNKNSSESKMDTITKSKSVINITKMGIQTQKDGKSFEDVINYSNTLKHGEKRTLNIDNAKPILVRPNMIKELETKEKSDKQNKIDLSNTKTGQNAGPKIVRNAPMIKEFELAKDKLKQSQSNNHDYWTGQNENAKPKMTKEPSKDKPKKLDQNNIGPNSNKTVNNENTEPKIVRKILNIQFKENKNTNRDGIEIHTQNKNELNKTESENKNTEPKIIRTLNMDTTKDKATNFDFNISSGHTFGISTDGPKVVRNVPIMKEFEEKLTKKPLDLELLNYNPIDDDYDENDHSSIKINAQNDHSNDKCVINDTQCMYSEVMSFDNCVQDSCMFDENNDISKSNGYEKDIKNEDFLNEFANYDNYEGSVYPNIYSENDDINYMNAINDSYMNDDTNEHKYETNDSGYGNYDAYSLVKSFLSEIDEAFEMARNFIDGSIKELKRHPTDEKMQHIHSAANAVFIEITSIIENLKKIIERETKPNTSLNTILANTGSQAQNDLRIENYREVILKYLNIAISVQNTLKTLLFT